MLIVFYAIVFAAAFLSDESILSVAFDSGGVTTGPMTVPFIMALGVGVASILKRRKRQGGQLRPRRSVLDRADLIGAAARCDLQNAARAGRERHRLRRRHHGRARQGLSACPAGVFMGSDNGAAADRCLLPDFSGHFAQAPQAAFHAHRDWYPLYILRSRAVPHGRERRLFRRWATRSVPRWPRGGRSISLPPLRC